MAGVTEHTARKAYTDIHGKPINPGDRYYMFQMFHKNPLRSLVPFKRWEIEQNEDRKLLYMAVDIAREELTALLKLPHSAESALAIEQILGDLGNELESIAEGLREKADNIEEGFGHQTPLSEELTEKADLIDEFRDSLSSFEVEEFDEEDAKDNFNGTEEDPEVDDEGNSLEEFLADRLTEYFDAVVDEALSLLDEEPAI